MKRHIYCFAHKQLAEAQALALMLPALEDANAIQIGIMRIQKALIEGTISTKMAGLLLYSMQLALQNVKNVTFGQAKAAEPVTETVDAEQALREKALSSQQSAASQNQRSFTAKDAEDAKVSKQDQHQHQRPLTTEATEDAEDEKRLPLMDADARGFKGGIGPVEWMPSPDMYRMDTREGMEAYEASFRMKIRTAPQGVIAPDDRAGTCNSSLRDERPPKGPRFACESLDADTGVGSVLQTEPYANLG
ncbi:MAG TPA: hypothetical protein VFQ41_03190 [Candidatus Angelobacter sp.]|nr:hypothetical protein [Candidatus Angelobacter sp.]